MVSVYVSYAWEEDEGNRLVEKLGEACERRGVSLLPDKTQLRYGDSIREFMDRLAQAEHVVVVLSDRYFRSRHCLYELRAIWRRGRIEERVYPIILDSLSSDPELWVRYLAHWESKKDALKEELNKLDREYTGALNRIADDYADFRRQIGEFLTALMDRNCLTEREHIETGFAALLDRVLAGQTAGTRSRAFERQSDKEFVATVEANVEKILGAQPSFADALRKRAKQQRLPGADELARCLCSGKLETVLSDVLRPATENALPGRSAEIMRASDEWEAAKSLVAWLSVLAVRPEWVQKREQLDKDGNALFEIFVKTECGVEIVSSRYRQIRPRFGPIKGFDVSGSDRLELPVHEPGWDGPEVLRQAQLEIARQIFPEPVGTRHTRKPTDDELIENLKVTLIERAKHKSHHHYILIGDDTTSPSANFCARLLDELPGLSVIHVPSSGGETALLVDNENELLAIIREFLKIPETEQRKR